MIEAAIERIYRFVMLAFGRGRVTFVDDSGPVQRAQVRFGPLEIIDNMPVPHDFGFTSNPPVQSDAFASFLGGNRKKGLVVSVGSQQYRMKNLKSGEVAIYDQLGQSVYLTQAGIIVSGAGLPMKFTNTSGITLDADVHITKSLSVDTNIVAQGDISDHGNKSMSAMRTAYNGHHNGTGTSTPDNQM